MDNNNQYLLNEVTGYAEMILEENRSPNSLVRFRGRFGQCDFPNENKRIYPRQVLENNVNRLAKSIAGNILFGELDHPTDSVVHLENVSHLITRLWFEDSDEGTVLFGEGTILPTPSGSVLRALTESGCKFGISSRGVGSGSTNENGMLVINDSFKLITFDAVASPSTFNAFQERITSTPKVKSENLSNFNNNIIKNETTSINKFNKEVMLASFSSMIEKQTQILRENIRERI